MTNPLNAQMLTSAGFNGLFDARAQTTGLTQRPLLVAGRSGAFYQSMAGLTKVASTTIPAGTIKGNCLIRLKVMLSKYSPDNAGWSWAAFIGGVRIAQNVIGANLHSVLVDQDVYITPDRKWPIVFNPNAADTVNIAAGPLSPQRASANQSVSLGARQVTQADFSFVRYAPAPAVETVIVDFDQPQELSIHMQAQNGDTVELGYCVVELIELPAQGHVHNSKATALWGDSLTEGAGSSAVSGRPMTYPWQLRAFRPSWPMSEKGLAGQKSVEIVNRLLQDGQAGMYWNCVLWLGTNDFDANIGNGPGWFAAIKAQIDRVIAFRGGTQRLMVCNLHPRAAWAVGDANYAALQYVNAQLAATYGGAVCDLFSALATEAGKVPAGSMADDVHLNNAGYATVANAINGKMTALGWS